MISALIFDMDGTVVSDEDVYGSAFKYVLVGLGVDTNTVSDYPQIGGIGVEENWPHLLQKYKVTTNKTPYELAALTHDAFLKNINQISIKPGFETLIQNAREEGVSTGLATSSTFRIADAVIEELDLAEYFDCVTTGEEVTHKKPSPEIFMLAADKLSVEASSCIVFEDSQSGIEAAMAAGMKVVGIYRNEGQKKTLSEAAILIPNFEEITMERLKVIE